MRGTIRVETRKDDGTEGNSSLAVVDLGTDSEVDLGRSVVRGLLEHGGSVSLSLVLPHPGAMLA